MSFILCPECGSKISNKAITCPHCGFFSNNPLLPISVQDTYIPVPTFKYEVEGWNSTKAEILSMDSFNDNRALAEYFGKWEIIQAKLPALAQTIKSMAKKESYLVAKIPEYVKKLIDKGIYQFNIDKEGQFLPTIRDSNRIVKQVRLEDMTLSPEVNQSLNNLSTQVMMAKILSAIQDVGDSIKALHTGLQNDRLALADSAMQQLQQTLKIQDSKLREVAILNVVNSATEAKCNLMRNFESNMKTIIKKRKESDFKKVLVGSKTSKDNSHDALQDVISITNAVQVECIGYSALGEYDSEKECLIQFKNFIESNRLNHRDTLLIINEGLDIKQNNIVDEFVKISNRITNYEKYGLINNNGKLLIEGTSNEG